MAVTGCHWPPRPASRPGTAESRATDPKKVKSCSSYRPARPAPARCPRSAGERSQYSRGDAWRSRSASHSSPTGAAGLPLPAATS